MSGTAGGGADHVLDDVAKDPLPVGEMAKGGRAHLAGGGPRRRFALGQKVQRHAGPGGDHQAQRLAVGLYIVRADSGLHRLPGLGLVGDDDRPRGGYPRVLGLFGLQLAGHGPLDGHVPQIGPLVAVDAHAVLQPHVVALQPGDDLGQVGGAAQLADRLVDGVMQQHLVGVVIMGGRPPAPLDVVGELVVAQLVLQIVGVALDAVDLQGGQLADVTHAVYRVAREHDEQLARAGEFVAPAIDARVHVIQRVIPKALDEGMAMHPRPRADDEIGGHADQAGGQRIRPANVADALQPVAHDVPGAGQAIRRTDGLPVFVVHHLDRLPDALLDLVGEKALQEPIS